MRQNVPGFANNPHTISSFKVTIVQKCKVHLFRHCYGRLKKVTQEGTLFLACCSNTPLSYVKLKKKKNEMAQLPNTVRQLNP